MLHLANLGCGERIGVRLEWELILQSRRERKAECAWVVVVSGLIPDML